MSDKVIELKKERERFNQRWRTDPSFRRDFDYEKSEYAACPDDLRWALPLFERQKTPAFNQWFGYHEALVEQRISKERSRQR